MRSSMMMMMMMPMMLVSLCLIYLVEVLVWNLIVVLHHSVVD